MRNLILILLGALFLLAAANGIGAEGGHVPPLPDSKVTIPWDEFLKLIEGAGPKPPPPPPPPPADAVVRRAAYTLVLGSGRLVVDEFFDASTYGDGWHEILVTGLDTPLVSLSVDGTDAVGLVRDDGVHVAVKGEGKWAIRARVLADAPDAPGPHTVTLLVPNTAAGETDLSFPTNYQDVTINGIILSAGPGRISAVMKGRGSVRVGYTVAAPQGRETAEKRPAGPPEVSAEVMSVLDFEEETILFTSLIDYRVRNAPVRSFTIRLPEELDLVDVTGRGIASWKVSEDKKALVVSVGYDVSDEYPLKLSFEREHDKTLTSVPFPAVIPEGTKRTSGYLAVVSGGGFEVTELSSSGLLPRDPSELPGPMLDLSGLPPVLSYRYTEVGFTLSLGVRKGEGLSALAAFVDSANSVILVTADGKAVVRTNYFVRNRSLQFLRINLPAGAVFWSATVKGAPAKASVDGAGAVMIGLPISTDANPEPFVVSVVALVPTDSMGLSGRLVLRLPRLEVPTAEMMATLYLPERKSYLSFGGDMEEIEYFTEVLAPEASESFVKENLRLRRSSYERQEELEDAINEQQQMPEKGGVALPPAPEGFDLPLRGKPFRFVKLIVLGEETTVTARYVDTRLLAAIVVLLVIAAAAAAMRWGRPLVGRLKMRLSRQTGSKRKRG
jgi:hypothetical protein